MSLSDSTLVGSFVNAAGQVLRREIGVDAVAQVARRGTNPMHCEEVSVIIGVIGDVKGQFILSMSTHTATSVVGLMMGEPVAELDEIGQSALAELGNMMAGLATVNLEQEGCSSNITPPSVLVGRGTQISTFGAWPLFAPLDTAFGQISVHVAISEQSAA